MKLCLFSFVSVGINSYYKLSVLVFMLSRNFACLYLKMCTKHLNKCRNSLKSWIMLFFLLIKNIICFNKTPRNTINLWFCNPISNYVSLKVICSPCENLSSFWYSKDSVLQSNKLKWSEFDNTSFPSTCGLWFSVNFGPWTI